MIERDWLITIDGPAGSGKTTLGHWLADGLGIVYLETGWLYRAATYRAISSNYEEAAWARTLGDGLDVEPRRPPPERRQQTVSLEGRQLDIAADLFSPEVEALVAQVASNREVRDAVCELARRVVERFGSAVISGRDAGTVIFPWAEFKIVLTAAPEVRRARVERRDTAAAGGAGRIQGTPTVDRLVLEAASFDEQAADARALRLDTTAMTIDAVRQAVLEHLGVQV